jgi:hypothetical protein
LRLCNAPLQALYRGRDDTSIGLTVTFGYETLKMYFEDEGTGITFREEIRLHQRGRLSDWPDAYV